MHANHSHKLYQRTKGKGFYTTKLLHTSTFTKENLNYTLPEFFQLVISFLTSIAERRCLISPSTTKLRSDAEATPTFWGSTKVSTSLPSFAAPIVGSTSKIASSISERLMVSVSLLLAELSDCILSGPYYTKIKVQK